MKRINPTRSNTLSKVFFDYMLPNPYFKITVIPTLLLLWVSGVFHNKIIAAVTAIETTFKSSNSSQSPEMMLVYYILTTIVHYLLVLVYMSIMGFYLQKNDVFSYKLHTYQYLLINHNDFHRIGTGKIHSLIDRRTTAVNEFQDLLVLNFYGGLSFIITTNISIYQKFGYGVMVFNVVLFVIYMLSCFVMAPMLDKYRIKANDSYNESSTRIFGIIQNYDTIKSFNHDRREFESLDHKLELVQKTWCVFELLQEVLKFFQNNLIVIPNCIVFYLALNKKGFSAIATFADLSIYNKMFMSLKNKIDTIGQEIVMMIAYSSNLNYDCIQDVKADDDGLGVHVESFNEKLTFRDFGLKIGDNLLLKNANFEICKGEKVAIVGKNGTGKSTLMKTLLRFYNHDGEILIDGKSTSDISVKSQRSLIAYIPQTPYMIEGSVLDNIKYANNKVLDSEVIELSKAFKTHRIFKTLEDGYLTNVGENGRFLSGGQKQQVSFLRAIVKNSDIFLIDEPTASLDHVAEADMIETIFQKMPEKTVIVIIHSFQYLSKFDKIIGLHNKGVNVYTSFEAFKQDMHLY